MRRSLAGSEPAAQARRVVGAYVVIVVVSWILVSVGITKLPPLPFVLVDVAVDVVTIAGLYLLWRVVWLISVAGTIVGEVTLGLHPVAHAVLLALGAAELALLFLPQLRRALRSRPTISRIATCSL